MSGILSFLPSLLLSILTPLFLPTHVFVLFHSYFIHSGDEVLGKIGWSVTIGSYGRKSVDGESKWKAGTRETEVRLDGWCEGDLGQ